MSFFSYSLHDIITAWDKTKIFSLLSSFRCSINPDAEDFLKNSSIRHEMKGISRTYLILQDDDSDLGYSLKGYFTLAIKCFTVHEEDEIPHDVMMQMNVNRKVAQAYLLGQLAKADGVEKGFGRSMMLYVLGLFKNGYKTFGCRTVRLDCKNEPKLVQYYESHGFVSIGENHDNALNQMVAIM